MVPPRNCSRRAFTLVELMIVVAIIGVLASLCIYGMRKYLAGAKVAEAKNVLGAINRSAVAAYERENLAAQIVGIGTSSGTSSHAVCRSAAAPVPNSIAAVTNRKYQANTAEGTDFNTGDAITGWKCLKFGLTEPQYYMYMYNQGTNHSLTPNITSAIPSATGWSGEATSDQNANGVFSEFLLSGDISNGQPVTSTVIATFLTEE